LTFCAPLAGNMPLQPPDALHDVAFVEFHVRVTTPPTATFVDDALRVAVGVGATGSVPPHASSASVARVITTNEIYLTNCFPDFRLAALKIPNEFANVTNVTVSRHPAAKYHLDFPVMAARSKSVIGAELWNRLCSIALSVAVCISAGSGGGVAYARGDTAPITANAVRVAGAIDSLDVETHWPADVHVTWETGIPDGRPDGSTGKHTHCSAFVAAAAKCRAPE
jgi:hypothetical protein